MFCLLCHSDKEMKHQHIFASHFQDDWADEKKYPILSSFDDFLLSVYKPAQ